ncbi:hypothetical protein ECPA49_1889, partial [Escherichia coli PA49]
FFTIYENFPV